MTLTEARKLLTPPLMFGNEAQIKAVRFLEKVEECCERIEDCEFFKSHFVCINHEDYDDDSSEESFFELIECNCVTGCNAAPEVVEAALQRIREK